MADKSAIEWTEATWNCLRGCTRVSEGCRFCYAMLIAARFSKPGQAYEGLAYFDNDGHPHWTGQVRLIEELLDQPLRWKRPRRIFVNSMSDLFHENVSDFDIQRIFDVMYNAPQHTFQILTKRPERMRDYFNAHRGWWGNYPQWKHVHLGVSVEDQKTADERIPLLLETPAAVRWISAEPLLGAIDLSKWLATPVVHGAESLSPDTANALKQLAQAAARQQVWATLDWVVVGGESGSNARPMNPAWARSLRDQCRAAGVAFFFKQWGEWVPTAKYSDFQGTVYYNDKGVKPCIYKEHLFTADWYAYGQDDGKMTVTTSKMLRVGKKEAGRLLEGRTWDEYPK
jgi:protein gp37